MTVQPNPGTSHDDRAALRKQKREDAAQRKREMRKRVAESAKSFEELLPAVSKASKDLRSATKLLGTKQVQYLVKAYYQLQKTRQGLQLRLDQLLKTNQPFDLAAFVFLQMDTTEKQIKLALEPWVEDRRVGRWLLSICGIGPVISAGLLSILELEPWTCADIQKKLVGKGCKEGAPCTAACRRIKISSAGHFWSFAGIVPGQQEKWVEGTVRPWNAQLKTLVCFKAGECFVKVKNNEKDFYGKIFASRRIQEEALNNAGTNAQQAKDKLARNKIGKDTDAYKYYSEGKLPPAHLHARARRYAVRLFLSHVHYVMYEDRYGVPPPKPYIIQYGGHTDIIRPPNWPIE